VSSLSGGQPPVPSSAESLLSDGSIGRVAALCQFGVSVGVSVHKVWVLSGVLQTLLNFTGNIMIPSLILQYKNLNSLSILSRLYTKCRSLLYAEEVTVSIVTWQREIWCEVPGFRCSAVDILAVVVCYWT